ncbi:MAG: PD-(D/E)XK motif protein [Phycisphaerales bacterium]|nr:PD-(D/E)XK motif protein [Phycisphaerales bacterium]
MRAVEAWRILRIGTEGDQLAGVATLDSGIDSKWGRPRFALGPMKQARFLVPVSRTSTLDRAPSSDALQTGILSLVVEGNLTHFLDLQCVDPALESVFGDVVDEIAARISAGREPAAAAIRTLEDFRSLLTISREREVSLASIAGLVAELIVLNSLLDKSSRSWLNWVGPLGDRHDFRSNRLSLEVKCSTRLSNRTITINSLEQLEPLPDGELFLTYYVLERVPDGQISVASLGLRALEKSSDAEGFMKRLQRAGCPDPRNAEWNRHSFQLSTQHSYRVGGDFPRLVPSMIEGGCLPAGIASITYEIEVCALHPYEMSTEDWEKQIGRIAGCP